MPVNRSALGRRIQIQRKRIDMSQNELADLIDKSTIFVSYIENGNKNLSLDTFMDIVTALQTTPNELLRDSYDTSLEEIAMIMADELGGCSDDERQLILEMTHMIQTLRMILSKEGNRRNRYR
ncbi:MAG: helix-turn-helix transcriptional regulator [Oscillospiraceae bacterium]|nr:helix-turn-helix transcriptional regulator [Oscillospiraceae bacterium]